MITSYQTQDEHVVRHHPLTRWRKRARACLHWLSPMYCRTVRLAFCVPEIRSFFIFQFQTSLVCLGGFIVGRGQLVRARCPFRDKFPFVFQFMADNFFTLLLYISFSRFMMFQFLYIFFSCFTIILTTCFAQSNLPHRIETWIIPSAGVTMDRRSFAK